jgi:TPP-dependent pyruvate/acetoin dehydrogenase alpha subunit
MYEWAGHRIGLINGKSVIKSSDNTCLKLSSCLLQIPVDTLVKMYENMLLLHTMDKILYDSQRQVLFGFTHTI